MNDKVTLVDYQESLSIMVGGFLVSKGFDLSNSTGMAARSLVQSDSLGILYKNSETKPKTYLFGLIKREPRRIFLGTIWFNNSPRNATEQNWVFETYGRKYVELTGQLAEEIASTFNVKITLRLVREQPDVETYFSDYSC
ncbi:MAG TPA: hypothetical protein VFM02_02835 [Candidatus Paceibacterota bacterium]|nr:hypothetical protein [Candidatus Paceibacterota bacterium]